MDLSNLSGTVIAIIVAVVLYLIFQPPPWVLGVAVFFGCIVFGLPIWVALLAGLVAWRYS